MTGACRGPPPGQNNDVEDKRMQLGMVGLGRMGANMVRRLMKRGHQCVVFDLNADHVKRLVAEGALGVASDKELVLRLAPPRVIWIMVPAGTPTENTVMSLAEKLQPGDILIDGGNSYYKDDVRRAKALKGSGIHYVDVGTSGGIWGVDRGYCLMVGGEPEAVKQLTPLLRTLAPGRGEIPSTPGRNEASRYGGRRFPALRPHGRWALR